MVVCLKQMPPLAFMVEKVTAWHLVWGDSRRPEWHYYKVRRILSVCGEAGREVEGSRTERWEECEECLERDWEKDWRERGGDMNAARHLRRNKTSGNVPMLRNGKCIFRTMMTYIQYCHPHCSSINKPLYFLSCFDKKSAVYNRLGLTVFWMKE